MRSYRHALGRRRTWRLMLLVPLGLVIPAALSAQSIADKKAERQAVIDETRADTLQLESELEAARREAQLDSMKTAQREDSDSLRAKFSEAILRIHMLEDSISVLQTQPSAVGSKPLQIIRDSLKETLKDTKAVSRALSDSSEKLDKRSAFSRDSAVQSTRVARDSAALALARDSIVRRLNPTHSAADQGDPERDHFFDDRDANFVNASVIKSIAGEKPSNEFFDLRFRVQIFDGPGHVDTTVVDTVAAGPGGKLQTREVHVGSRGISGKQLKVHMRQPWSFFTISAIDVAMSTVIDSNSSDSAAQRERQKLTEATLALQVGLPAVVRMSDNKVVRFRRYFFGPLIKVFSADPYYGLSGGSVELEGSSFRSSYLFTAFLRRFYPNPELRIHSFYVEFFLRSSRVDFFKILCLRGGVLFPLGKDAARQGVVSRIAIEVPVVSWPF
jgi:hypothetical protein